MTPRPGLTRTIVNARYALVTPDGYVPSAIPGWTGCRFFVQISAAMGAHFSQYLLVADADGRGTGQTGHDQWFLYVMSGAARVNRTTLEAGGFAFVPPGTDYAITTEAAGTRVLVFRKAYAALDGHGPPPFFASHERDVPEAPFLGDPRARLKVLIPDSPGADMAVNVFTYDPGATLPFVETHVMEHGMLFLAGGGVYRLDSDWHPVTAGDAIWIAPYCPQWFIAAGPDPARYIYYKDVNRLPA